MYVISEYRRAEGRLRCADSRKKGRRKLHGTVSKASRAASGPRRGGRQLGSWRPSERPRGTEGGPPGPREEPVKALDTPVLLAILHGDRNVRGLLRKLRGVEVATTELNFLELQALLARVPVKERSRRREALDRLRRSLTVLPFDSKSADRLNRRVVRGDSGGLPLLQLGALATLEANGCDELFSLGSGAELGRWSFRISSLGR
jgi:predicted nucleic acid-binding protein